MKCIAFIPARYGSKGIAKKNLEKINGISLVRRIAIKALNSDAFDEVILSSDNIEILNEVEDLNVVKHLRSESAAGDNATAYDVMKEFFDAQKGFVGLPSELIICYLQATSPFTSVDSIISVINLHLEHRLPVITIAPSNEHPLKALGVDENGVLSGYITDSNPTANRQLLSPAYFPTGGIYCFTLKDFLKYSNVPVEGSLGFLVDFPENLDVDTYAHLAFARHLASEYESSN